jgi:TonB family protein
MYQRFRRIGTRRVSSLIGSTAMHCLLLFLLVWHPGRILRPNVIVKGTNGTSTELVYLPSEKADPSQPVVQARSSIRIPKPSKQRRKTDTKTPSAKEEVAGATVQTTRAGSPFGSQYDGITVGHEVKPALPVSGDRPRVSRSELPTGVQGDVIVEITIDIQGNVVQTKLLKTIGYGIDQKVLATLQNWHFTPAMQDGVAIPSQQDVYFHFPG